MHVRKRIFAFIFAALAVLLCTACGKWDYSREAVKAANEAQGETLRVEFKVNQTFTNALRAAVQDNIQPTAVEAMNKALEGTKCTYRYGITGSTPTLGPDSGAKALARLFNLTWPL